LRERERTRKAGGQATLDEHIALGYHMRRAVNKGGENMEALKVIVQAMIAVESGGDVWAMRFEEGFYRKLCKLKHDGRVEFLQRNRMFTSKDTACMLLSTSYGLLQPLGYNIVWVAQVRGEVIDCANFTQEAFSLKTQAMVLAHYLLEGSFSIQRIAEAIERRNAKEWELRRWAKAWNGSEAYSGRLTGAVNTFKYEDMAMLIVKYAKRWAWHWGEEL